MPWAAQHLRQRGVMCLQWAAALESISPALGGIGAGRLVALSVASARRQRGARRAATTPKMPCAPRASQARVRRRPGVHARAASHAGQRPKVGAACEARGIRAEFRALLASLGVDYP